MGLMSVLRSRWVIFPIAILSTVALISFGYSWYLQNNLTLGNHQGPLPFLGKIIGVSNSIEVVDQPVGPEVVFKKISVKDPNGAFIIISVNRGQGLGETQVGQTLFLKPGVYTDLHLKYAGSPEITSLIQPGTTLLIMLTADSNHDKRANNGDKIVAIAYPTLTAKAVSTDVKSDLILANSLTVSDQSVGPEILIDAVSLRDTEGGFVAVVKNGTELVATSAYLPAGQYKNIKIKYYPAGSNYAQLTGGDKLEVNLLIDKNRNFRFDPADIPAVAKKSITLR